MTTELQPCEICDEGFIATRMNEHETPDYKVCHNCKGAGEIEVDVYEKDVVSEVGADYWDKEKGGD